MVVDDKQYLMDVICPILFVMGDGKSNDALTGRYATHTEGVKRHCRACKCDVNDLDNPYVVCESVRKSMMEAVLKRNDDAELKELSQYHVDNAFSRLMLPVDDYGIWGATPTDLMHALPLGIFKYCLEIIITDSMPPRLRMEIDVMASDFNKRNRQMHRRTFPKTDFSKGVTNLTLLTADEMCGLMFLLTVLFQTSRGWEILEETIEVSKVIPETVYAEGIMEVLECLLCFWAWTRQAEYWHLEDDVKESNAAQYAIRMMLNKVVTQLPRKSGMGWKVSKFHEMLHLVEDIRRYGSPRNTNTSAAERNHVQFAKRPGRRSQKRHVTFDKQVATRITDSMILRELSIGMELNGCEKGQGEEDMVVVDDEFERIEETTIGGTQFALQINALNQTCMLLWNSQSDAGADGVLRSELILFIISHFWPDIRLDDDSFGLINLSTEYKRDIYRFRVHPNYRNKGVWQDWILVEFENEVGEVNEYPFRIEAIVPMSLNREGLDLEVGDVDTVYLVVSCCTVRTEDCCLTLFEDCEYDPNNFYVIEGNSIVSPCFVVEDCGEGGEKRALVARSYDGWAIEFLDMENIVEGK